MIDKKTFNGREFVEKHLGTQVDAERKKTIVASLNHTVETAAVITEEMLLNILGKLANTRKPSVMSYSADQVSCPRCKSQSEPVILHNSRKAYYCAPCRIVMPAVVKDEA